MPDTSNSFYAARPLVRIGGQDNAELGAGLLSLVIEETAAGLYRCEALFGNWGAARGGAGFLYFDRSTLDFGKGLQVVLGGATLFDGRITALEARFPEGGPPQINVLAEDRLQDLRMTRRTRCFADLGDRDLFSRIAGEHGLSASADLTGPTHKVLAQLNESDLAFLRGRARALDAEVWVEGTVLHAAPRASRSRGQPFELALGARLREFSAIADLAHQCTAVTAGGWDIAAKTALDAEAAEAAIASELDGGLSGASVLGASLGQRRQVIAHGVPLAGDEARGQAEAAFRTLARRFVVGRGLARTDARLRVGASVDLKGLGPLFSGRYYVAQVRHLFDSVQGIRSEFTAERAALGRA